MTTQRRSFLSLSGTGGATTAFIAALVALCPTPAAHAQLGTIFQTGFEASEGYSATRINQVNLPSTTGGPVNFTSAPGALFPQKNFSPITSLLTPPNEGAVAYPKFVNGTTVVNTVAATGSQSVKMTGATLDNYFALWSAAYNIDTNSTSVLNVAVDMSVTNPSASYGQWGISFLAPPTASSGGAEVAVGAFGSIAGNVIGSNNGTSLYAAFNPLTGQAYKSTYGSFNNYSLQLNFATQNISGFYNGSQVAFLPIDQLGNPAGAPVLNMPFSNNLMNSVADVTFGDFTPNTAENAYFDNLRISGSNVKVGGTAAAPEPGTLVLMGLGLCGVRRRRQQK